MRVIRASKIGFPCIRNIWLSTMGLDEVFDKKTLRIFDLGNLVEQVAVKWLREDGWGVYWNEGSQDAEWELNVPLQGGVLRGHPDCIIEKDRQRILADIKSMNSRAYKHWLDGGTINNKLSYFIQVNVYAYAINRLPANGPRVDKVAIVGVNKDTSDYTIEVLDIDEDLIKETLNKAQFILNAPSMPPKVGWAFNHLGVSNEVPSWCCSYCGYKKLGICDGVRKGDENND